MRAGHLPKAPMNEKKQGGDLAGNIQVQNCFHPSVNPSHSSLESKVSHPIL
jgi:hypothetical protein